MINLFEYQNKEVFSGNFEELEIFLDDIWNKREKSGYYFGNDSNKIEVQRFLQFIGKTRELKSNRYVGVIHFEDHKINLLPKIFHKSGIEFSQKEVNAAQNHILWWLSYCRKIKFPNYQTSLGSQKSDFFEVLIYLFSKYTRELLSNSIYQQYEEINRELSFIKGRLNVNEYINQNLSRGRWHKLNCTYDAFVFDNKFNRIIKYVATLLFNHSSNSENKKYLREILFILDEVSDIRATASDCASIQFNPMFGDFETVRDYCQLFLNNSISLDYKNDLKLFAFLLPMETVFEDFVFGFIEKEIEEINAKAQVGLKHLDRDKNFKLRPDLFLKIEEKEIIADTKYKIAYSDEKDPKNGISQNDLYQMLAYAVRYNINDIVLFYPNLLNDFQESESEIIIEDDLAGGKEICIKSYQLPILNKLLFEDFPEKDLMIDEIFEGTKTELINRLKTILITKVKA